MNKSVSIYASIMASIPKTIGDFTVLPISIPPMPSYPQTTTHHVYTRPHTPKIPTRDDSRSLFLANVPVDSTEAHFRALFTALRRDLTERFGGVTVHARGPAEGFWDGEEGHARDDIVIFEVMAEDLDAAWWRERRQRLEEEFRQDEVVVRVQAIRRL